MSAWLESLRAKVGNDLLILASSAGLLFDGDRMLVVRDVDSGRYVAPGGYLDPGESPAECCERELREELGVPVRVIAILGAFSGPEFMISYSNGHEVQPVISVFECERVEPDAPIVTDDVEVTGHRWVTRTELDELPLQPWAASTLGRVWDARATGAPLPR